MLQGKQNRQTSENVDLQGSMSQPVGHQSIHDPLPTSRSQPVGKSKSAGVNKQSQHHDKVCYLIYVAIFMYWRNYN